MPGDYRSNLTRLTITPEAALPSWAVQPDDVFRQASVPLAGGVPAERAALPQVGEGYARAASLRSAELPAAVALVRAGSTRADDSVASRAHDLELLDPADC